MGYVTPNVQQSNIFTNDAQIALYAGAILWKQNWKQVNPEQQACSRNILWWQPGKNVYGAPDHNLLDKLNKDGRAWQSSNLW